MKKNITILLLTIFIIGCATATMDVVRNKNREGLNKLSIGMPKEEALRIMGTETIKTCPNALFSLFTFGVSQTYCQDISNPYRTEILQGKDKIFEVTYYYTDIKSDTILGVDRSITDDELTPLIFDNGKLIGWGWSFLQDNIQKYEIRVR